MKFIVIVILSFALVKYSFGQSDTYKEYIENEWIVFSSLDNNYRYYLRELNVSNLTEWRFTFDTTGTISDSTICFHLKFDTIGRLIEWSKKFIYEKEQITDTIYNNPFPPDYIMRGIGVGKMQQNCEYRNKSYQIDSIIVQQSVDDKLVKLYYYYHPELFVKHFYYMQYLIARIDYFEGDNLKYRHVINYVIKK
jgi:hypothetical protein